MALAPELPTSPAPGRFQARRAFMLLREVIRNPEDTDRVFEFFEAVGGDEGPNAFRRLVATEGGRRLLAARPCLVEVLADETYLASLPEDSFGGWYLRFMRSRGFAPSGLLEARERGAGVRVLDDAEHEWLYDRINVMHDLWHVLTGYGTDELGEAALLAFSHAQIPNRSFPLLLAAAVAVGPKSWDLAWPRYLWRAYRRGRRATLLTAAPYEELLPRPIAEVRARLRIEPSGARHPDRLCAAARGGSRRLPLATLVTYAAPGLGFGFMQLLVSTYFMKHATDVLAIPAATMGGILLLSRAWDAVAGPVAGYLSDRTHTRFGRRRPWLVAGALPLALGFTLAWSPPRGLSGGALVAWTGLAVMLFFTSLTLCRMPHEALAAELSRDYHDRNRVYGVKRALFGVGTLAVFAALAWLGETSDPRAATLRLSLAAGATTAVLLVVTGCALREPAAHLGRGAVRPLRAAHDVLANPHARRLLAVSFLQQVATGTVTTAAAYHTQYVLGDAGAFPLLLGCFFLASLVSIPLWLRLGSRFEKKPLLVASMMGVGVILGAMLAVGEGDHVLLFSLAAVGGCLAGGLDVIMPSLQADVIDFDELRTGERKEGVYFAAWHLAEKLALGVAAAATGLALAGSGFVPNVEQGPRALLAMRLLLSLFPLCCYAVGAALFVRFGLDRAAHARVQRALAERGATRSCAAAA